MNSARYPVNLRDPNIKPTTERTYEFGTAFSLLKNRLYGDITYYNKYQYNLQVNGSMSYNSGFESKLVNTMESYERKGVEVTLGGRAIDKSDFKWDINFNWAQSKRFYKDLDSVFSADRPWVRVGARVDAYTFSDWERDPNGNIIHRAGLPVSSSYTYQIGWSDPLWNWGLSNTFSYKHFSLGLSFDGRFKGLSNSGTNSRLWQTGAHIDSDTKERYEEVVNGNRTYVGEGVKIVSGSVKYNQYGGIVEDSRVFAPNDETVSFETYWRRSYSGRHNVWDETFIKLREISLRYNLPQSVSKSIRARNASVAFVGQNVFLWSKEYRFSDPDKASDDLNSPSVRYLGVNININF
jgi:hypothetical protein